MGEDSDGPVAGGRHGKRRATRRKLPGRVAISATVAQGAFLTACRARGLKPKTISWYRTILDRFARAFDGLPSNPQCVEEFLGNLEVGAETRFDYWRGLRTFYRWVASRYGLVDPMGAVASPRRRRRAPLALTEGDVRLVMAGAMTSRDKALLALLLDTGIRIGEAYTLTWSSVGQETIVVDGKTGPREVPISSWTRWVLLGVDLPWRGRRGGPITLNGLQQAVRRCLRRAGVMRGTAHIFRHTFARLYIRAGGDAFSLQRILGHQNLTTTRIYVELEVGDLVERHRRFSPIVRLLELAADARPAEA